jgi:hypothetical protein
MGEEISKAASVDQRRRRSSVPEVALHHWLGSVRSRTGAEAVVVTDEQGTWLGSSGPWALCGALALLAPTMGAGEVRSESLARTVHVERVRVSERDYLVAVAGEHDLPGTSEVTREGVARILAA